MKYKLFAIAILCFSYATINAQRNLITLENETNETDGVITISAFNQGSGIYTLKINFNIAGFTSTYGNPYFTTVNQGKSQVCKLTPDKNAGFRSVGYSYTYYAGTSFRKAPNNYMHYLLPITPGRTTLVTPVSQLSSLLEQKSETFFYAQSFSYSLGDTICATRAGVIYNINDELKQGEGKTTVYADDRNKIYIQHKDGTVAHYTILAPMQNLVQNGESVIPGQPLAVFNKKADKYNLLFSVFYLDESKIRQDNSKEVYVALPTYYYLNPNAPSTTLTEGQKYEATKSLEIIAEELSKKEKKKLGL